MLSDLEEFIGIPAHNTTRKPTPTPLDDPRDDLALPKYDKRVRTEGADVTYHGLGHA